MSRLDRNLTPIYGTAWLGECGRVQRDALHERTRPPGERLITKQPSPRPNDPYPGIQEVSADESTRLAEESREVREMEAAQTGAGVYPFSVRRKSVLVNEVPVEMDSLEREREREVRTVVI
jgi:hypothetical protein